MRELMRKLHQSNELGSIVMTMGNYRFDQQLAMDIGEKLWWAVLILVVTWALARAAKWGFAKLVDKVGFDN